MDQKEYQQIMSELNYYQDLLEQVERSLLNLKRTKDALIEFEKESGKSVLAPIANGVYVEAEIKNKDLYVNIGSDVVSKKSIPDAIKIIEIQEEDVKNNQKVLIEKIEAVYNLLQDVPK
ncbi:MAG: prefoldin subunit alpha [Candidatus Woesearchaeota archaeon]